MHRYTVGDGLTNGLFGVLDGSPNVLEADNLKWMPCNATSHTHFIACALITNCKTFPRRKTY